MGPPRYGRLAKLAVSESVGSPKRIFSAAKRFTVFGVVRLSLTVH